MFHLLPSAAAPSPIKNLQESQKLISFWLCFLSWFDFDRDTIRHQFNWKAWSMGAKNVKRERGKPICYEEVKEPMNFSITPIARQILEKMAEREMCSRSELIERWVRGRLLRITPEEILEISEAVQAFRQEPGAPP